ncbi:hypothetical protein [Streptococcus lutetiensis]|uniref:hypothetical protein n=1 Tax=Streptococcus lutetiensis TaxID=150055 RepID=UPI001BD94251|nr:hypothetical protein [Streptococcus lutetiensis]MBT0943389.1 hypothetical protein [Streptococcus lutetiensis]MBT0950213.1 hypothetical protein [Streptococcus lutetiensis]
MTYLIVAVAILGLTEVLTLTLLKRRNEDIRYYRSEDYKNHIFTERARSNSRKWSQAHDAGNH